MSETRHLGRRGSQGQIQRHSSSTAHFISDGRGVPLWGPWITLRDPSVISELLRGGTLSVASRSTSYGTRPVWSSTATLGPVWGRPVPDLMKPQARAGRRARVLLESSTCPEFDLTLVPSPACHVGGGGLCERKRGHARICQRACTMSPRQSLGQGKNPWLHIVVPTAINESRSGISG